MDKLDMILIKLEIMQCEIDKIKSSVEKTISNQFKITTALNQNFQTIVKKQIEIAIVLKQSLEEVQNNELS
jgi:hypothetical protein